MSKMARTLVECPHINSPPRLSLSLAGLKDGDALQSLMYKAPCLASGKAGSNVLRYKALGLILRLACDLPTIESMLETMCVLFRSALFKIGRKRSERSKNRKGISGLCGAPMLC